MSDKIRTNELFQNYLAFNSHELLGVNKRIS